MKKQLIAMTGTALVVLVGCRAYDDYHEARVDYAIRHFEQAQQTDLAKGRVITLDEAVKMTIAGNLDLSVNKLEEKVAKEAVTAELLGMLPTMTFSDSDSKRSNKAASSSLSKGEDGWVAKDYDAYSMSQEQEVNYFNIDLALSTLDFGLAYFNTSQAKDRELIREQRTKRAEQGLTLDAVRTYFKVAAAQRAVRETQAMLASCTNRYELIETLGRSGKISPFRAFDEMRKFTDMEKRLTNFTRSYESAKSELRSLMGLYPNAEISVDDAILDVDPTFVFPDIKLMEQIAVMCRPELYEIDMQKHININECRKTILMMLPNVRMFEDYTRSSNKYLYNKSWGEVGFRAAYDLLSLPKNIARYRGYSAQVDADEMRSYAQAIAVMAQVRMAHANVIAARERLTIDTRINEAYQDNLRKAEGAQRVSGSLSNLELAHMRMSTAEASIDRMVTLGNYYVSYFQLLNVLGVEALDDKTIADAKEELRMGDERVHEEEYTAKREAEIAQAKVAAEQAAAAEEAKREAEEAAAEAKREAEEAAAEQAEAEAEAKAEAEEAAAEAKREAEEAAAEQAEAEAEAKAKSEEAAAKLAAAEAEAKAEAEEAAAEQAEAEAEAKAEAERAAAEQAAAAKARAERIAERERRKEAGETVYFWEYWFD